MFILQAPFPALQTTILLPSAELGNKENLSSSVQTIRAIDGTLYTYIKEKRARKVYSWDFLTSRDKADETKEFVRRYAGSLVMSIDHNNVKRVGYITINPIEFSGAGRADGWPSGEACTFTIQLEEKI